MWCAHKTTVRFPLLEAIYKAVRANLVRAENVAHLYAYKERHAPEALSKAVRANLVRAENVAHLYAYKERRTDVHTNPFGRDWYRRHEALRRVPIPDRQLNYRRLSHGTACRLPTQSLPNGRTTRNEWHNGKENRRRASTKTSATRGR